MRFALLVALPTALAGCVSQESRWRQAPPPRSVSVGVDAAAPTATISGPLTVDLPTVLRLAHDRSLDIALVRAKLDEAYALEVSANERFFPWLVVGSKFQAHNGLTQATDGSFQDVDKQSAHFGAGPSLQWDLGDAI